MALSLDWIGAWAQATEREIGEEAFQRDVTFLARIIPLMEIWSRYFDAEVRGLEHVPGTGPVLCGVDRWLSSAAGSDGYSRACADSKVNVRRPVRTWVPGESTTGWFGASRVQPA